MNRTNLSPATSAIVLRLLTAEVIRTEEAHRVAGEAFGAADAAHGRVANQRGKLADARYDARQKALGATQAAERTAREARWALAEYRRAAGLDVDHDAAELAAQ